MEVNVPLQLQLSFPLPPFHGDHVDLMFGAEPFRHLEDPPLNPSFDIWIGAVIDESYGHGSKVWISIHQIPSVVAAADTQARAVYPPDR